VPDPVAVEASTGAQLLPRPKYRGEAAQALTEWVCFLALDADMRTKHEAHRDTAAKIIITYPKE